MNNRKEIFTIIGIIFIGIVAFILSLYLHELGHMLTAMLLLDIPMGKIKLGLESYAEVNVVNATNVDMALISIGSFILPQIVYWILISIKNVYISLFRIMLAAGHYTHLVFSAFIIIVGSELPEKWDILLFINYLNIDNYSGLIFIILILLIIINVLLEYRNVKKFIDFDEKETTI